MCVPTDSAAVLNNLLTMSVLVSHDAMDVNSLSIVLIRVNRVFQGAGRYAIYIANYASGKVGPHALIEMDESASDLSQGVIALSNVAEQAGVNKFTGRCEETTVCVCVQIIQHHWTFTVIYTDICREACACCACPHRV